MMIQAALNGGRSASENRAVPVTPEQMGEEGRKAVDAGAACLHIHVRDPKGLESLAPEDVAAALAGVRIACPGIPVGISTGAWILRDAAKRREAVTSWVVLPDYVSINLREEGALDLADRVLQMKIGIEAGIWDASDVQILLDSGLAPLSLRLLMEPMEKDFASAAANVEKMILLLDGERIKTPRLLHGVNATAWSMLRFALEKGYDTRIGLEDVLTLPDGSPATGNAALVAAAIGLASSA
jgi:uncharacterized protein (DUF849 family)